MPKLNESLITGTRVVVAGDSLAFHNGFPNFGDYLHAGLRLQNPSIDFHFQSLARSGLSIAGLFDSGDPSYEVYNKWIMPLAPDYVIVEFADNGGYGQATELAHMETLIGDYIETISGAIPIMVGMIPQSDTDGYTNGGLYDINHQAIAEAATPNYEYVRTWDALQATFRTYQAMTADAGTDTLTSTAHGFTDGTRIIFQGGTAPGGISAETYYFVRDATANTFKLALTLGGDTIDITSNGSGTINVSSNWARLRGTTAADEIHPSTAGSILGAWKMWTGLGWGTDVSSATINAATGSVVSEDHCTNTNVVPNRYGGIDFDRLDDRLPWAIDESFGGAGRADAVAMHPEIVGWQDYSLTVAGLPSGSYEVFCNGDSLGTVSHAQLANGWNMADLTTGPVWEKGQEVLGCIRDMQGISRSTLLEVTSPSRYGVEKYKSTADGKYEDDGLRGAPLIASLSTVLGELDAYDADILAAAQPETLAFSIRRVGWTPPIGIPDCAWGALHPITEPTPAQPGAWPSAEAAGYYYVDNTHVSATDANTYGYPNAPRLTIPETTLAAGSYVEIHGGPYARRSGDEEHDFVFAGTEAQPCWIVAHDITAKPELQGGFEVSGTYAIFDGILFKRDTDAGVLKGPGIHVGGDLDAGTSYICFRNCETDGDEVELGGSASSSYSITGSAGDETHHIVFYNCSVHDYGNMLYTQTVAYSDDHAWLPGQYCNNVWIVDCTATACSGDAVQVTGNNALGDARANNIYIGRNEFHYTGENAVDVKSSVDVIISQNRFYNLPGGLGGNGTAIVVQQEGGSGCDNVWALFNEVSECFECIRAEEVATNIYAIGNVFHSLNSTGAAAITARTPGTDLTLVDNTIYGLPTGIPGSQWDGQGGIAPNIQFHGNLWAGKADDTAPWYEGDATTIPNDSDRNAYDSGSVFKAVWEGSTYTSLAAFTAGKGQDTNGAYGDCDLIDPENDDFGIGASSVARGINVEHAAYAAFQSRYSLDIRKDFYGNARPTSGAWDAGALQYGSVPSFTAPGGGVVDPPIVDPPVVPPSPTSGKRSQAHVARILLATLS